MLLTDNDNSRQIGATYTINSADTWEKKIITFAGDTSGALDNDNAHSMNIIWWLVVGTDRTSGTAATSWQSSVNANAAVGQTVNLADSTSNEFYITGIQWETDFVTFFESKTPSEDQINCDRYYMDVQQLAMNNTDFQGFTFRQKMRATPSMSAHSTVRTITFSGVANTGFHAQTTHTTGWAYRANAEL